MDFVPALFFLFALLPVTLFPQSDTPAPEAQPQVISFSDYVSNVLIQLPDIQLNKLKVYDAEVSRLRASTILDYNFEAKLGIFQNTDFTGSVTSPFNIYRGLEVGASVSKVFPEFGGRFKLDLSYRQFSAFSYTGQTLIDAIFRIPVLSLSYGIPLLKNVLGILDRYPLKMAGLDVKITQWTVEEENAWILANYKKFYFQWYVSGQMISFLDEALKNANELEALAKAQRSTGFIDDADFQNVQVLKLDIDNERLNALNVFTNLREQISILIGINNIAVDPEEWARLNAEMDVPVFQSIPFTETRQNLILDFLSQGLVHSLHAANNARLPELNIVGSIAMETYTTNTPPIAPNQVIILPTYYAGLQVKYPFGDHESRARRLEIQKKTRELEFLAKKYIKEYTYKADSKARSLVYYRSKLNNRSAARLALESRYRAQRRRYGQGRETLAALVDTRNKILENRIDEADLQLQLIYDYFEFLVLNNKDEASVAYQGGDDVPR